MKVQMAENFVTYLKAWLNFNYTFISFLCWLMLWVHLHACSIKILDRRLPNLRYSNTTTTFDVLRLCVIHTYLTTRVVFLLKNKCVSFYGQLKHLFYLLLLLKVISTWNGSNKTEKRIFKWFSNCVVWCNMLLRDKIKVLYFAVA